MRKLELIERMKSEKKTAVLLLTSKLQVSPTGGREMLCKLNHDALANIYDDQMIFFEITKKSTYGPIVAVNAFSKGYIDGVNAEIIKNLLHIIAINNISKIFVDGSNFGEMVRQVKLKYPLVHIHTFFHNVESRFFWGSLKEKKSLRSLAIYIANYLAERKAVIFSDKIICLSERDSQLLKTIYGRSATHISSMALEDKLPSNFLNLINPLRTKYALFVGGDFYANRVGISWFVKNVAPKIHFKVCVVGKGLERYKQELELVENVEVIGAVDSLADWYLNAHFVIAPIFDGSGMKTKVAEALMYGKKVIGTPEAFSGYEADVDKIGKVCKSEADFVKAIEMIDDMVASNFDKDLRAIYENKYSSMAAKIRFHAILNECS
jgi:glycosyltransferase involved in cell wall biosynthesis